MMCIVCKEWNLGRLTSKEALRNLGEMIVADKDGKKSHYLEASEKILDKEVPNGETDSDLDRQWHDENYED